MKVFVADKLPQQAIDELKELGLDVEFDPSVTSSKLDQGLDDTDILIVRSTELTETFIQNSPRLMLIIRAGAGVNTIDIEAASNAGVYVANCPGQNSIAVAELTMGLIVSLDRYIADNVSDFRNGKWNKKVYGKADGLFGKTLGIVGVGQIGQEVIKRAKAFGLDIVAWSRSLTPEIAEEMEIGYADSAEEVAGQCDILSVHLAMTPDTKGIISKKVLSLLKDGAFFINTARAGVVDEDALYEELKSGRIKAGLDLIENEPEYKQGEVESRFQELDNVQVTHHIGASTKQAQLAVASDAVDIVRGYLEEGEVRNWLNRCAHTEAPWKLVVRHYDKAGVLANVMNELKKADINAQELENVIFEGKKTACCTIQLDAQPADETLENIRTRQNEVISAMLIEN
ncbi:3-phosphoglycerate dehydrogenase family protein [Fodinibius halophilus]|uniref:Phosphoglycerate dehydrogenase n=1 Tax=Fodinibius halophilus TaxID=1736908 RepID=A0A6M1SZ85_9BACT|nr:3-phosphoglycerate dehydrogenase family protein [Fodinibius halophilus]NGP88586.1 phosphoglycerate dehydrogenase [Fodinibius halophilus]